MPVFYILVFLALIVIWFLASFLFRPLGRFVHRIWKDARDAIVEEDKNENKKE